LLVASLDVISYSECFVEGAAALYIPSISQSNAKF